MFCTAVNCMDGRVQLTVINYMQKRFNAIDVDMITEPGPNKILAEGIDTATVASIMRRIDISVYKHDSKGIAIVGHEDCGGNPAGKDEQCAQLRIVRSLLKEKYPAAEIIALWVNLKGNTDELA